MVEHEKNQFEYNIERAMTNIDAIDVVDTILEQLLIHDYVADEYLLRLVNNNIKAIYKKNFPIEVNQQLFRRFTNQLDRAAKTTHIKHAAIIDKLSTVYFNVSHW